MALLRMDNVGIVVDDLDAAIAFFEELGLVLEGRGEVAGDWVDRTVGLTGIHCAIAMLRMPDGPGRLELSQYHTPIASEPTPPNPPHNVLGTHRVMFAVDDIDDTIERLRRRGAELLDGIGEFDGGFRLCYLRGPAGIILALAQQV
ncbi:VOC family protein [Kribbella sp. NPDC004536]|uniref:VOC family protein n=1 Tax=Kribbella sp. NPDC004536 TaxID=3364106 RepID=UPI003675856E